MKFKQIPLCMRGVHLEKYAAVHWVHDNERLQGEPSVATAEGTGLERLLPSLLLGLLLATLSKILLSACLKL